MPDFTDDELLKVYHNPKADLSLLSREELSRLDKLTAETPAATSGPQMSTLERIRTQPHSYEDYSGGPNDTTVNRTSTMLKPLAQPESMGDMAGLLLPNFGGVAGAMTKAAGPAVQKVGGLVERAGDALRPLSRRAWMGGGLQILTGNAPTAIAATAAPPVVRGMGRAISAGGRALAAEPAEEPILNRLFGINSRKVHDAEVMAGGPGWMEGEFSHPPDAPPETGVVTTGRSSGPIASPASSMQEPRMLPSHQPAGLPEHPPEWEVIPSTGRPVEAGPSSRVLERGLPPATRKASPEMFMPASSHEVTSYQPGPMDEVLGTAAPAQELGQPRVKSWKPGYGPSADDAKALRDKFGSKTTASLLATSQKQVKNLTGDVVPAVPSHVRARIAEKMGTLSPEEQAAYLAQSQNNPRMSDFIRSLMK